MGTRFSSERSGEVQKTVASGTKRACARNEIRIFSHARNLDYMNFSTRVCVSDDVSNDVTDIAEA